MIALRQFGPRPSGRALLSITHVAACTPYRTPMQSYQLVTTRQEHTHISDGVDVKLSKIHSELDQIQKSMRQLQEVIDKSRSEQIEFQKIQSLQWAINNIKTVTFHYTTVKLLEDKKETILRYNSHTGNDETVQICRIYSHDNDRQSSDLVVEQILWSFMKGQDYYLGYLANGCILEGVHSYMSIEYSEEEIAEGVNEYREKLCESIHKLTGHRPRVLRDDDGDVVIRW